MALALSADGMPIHIDDAINGKACNSTCIGCGCPVIAKNRGKVAFHYSHDPEFYDPEVCNWSPETELHLMAKMAIAEDQKLRVPIGTIEPNFKDIHFEDVKLEKRVDNRIPDINAYSAGEHILIEIAVTHPCEPDKISEMKRAHKNCVELDLSEFNFEEQTLDLNTVRKFILEAPIKWLAISPVGDIGQMTYSHNLNIQRPLAAKIKSLSEELSGIEAEEPLIRQKYRKASDALTTLLAKIDEQTTICNEQNRTIKKYKSQFERLRNLDEELAWFAIESEKLIEKEQLLNEKARTIRSREISLRHQQIEDSRQYDLEDKASQIKSDLEAEFKEKCKKINQEREQLKQDRRTFDIRVKEQVEKEMKIRERDLLTAARKEETDILRKANDAKKRTLELIQPMPGQLKKQFSKARSFAKTPYEVITEIEEIVALLSKRPDA